MRKRILSFELAASFAMLTLTGTLTPAWAVKTATLHNFNNFQGSQPTGVVIGPDGNLYGATINGGPDAIGGGTVYELTPDSEGQWFETMVLDFGLVGAFPNGNLIFDNAGNIYGTSQQGTGVVQVCGCCVCGNTGLVFKLTHNPRGRGWDETSLLSFVNYGTVMFPSSGLVRDSAGNLYGLSSMSDGTQAGCVFEASPAADGGWSSTIVTHGEGMVSGPLAVDGNGNFYGTVTYSAGEPNGNVWKLNKNDGTWTELFTFPGGNGGANPVDQGGLILDAAGNIYGTTQNGGVSGKGTVFELSPGGDGTWTEKVLYSFDGRHGGNPSAGVISDTTGTLYGEASSGGDGNSGVVFQLTPKGDGSWAYATLRSFHGPDGNGPSYGLILDAAGNLYGTTWAGGTYGNGTVFEVTP